MCGGGGGEGEIQNGSEQGKFYPYEKDGKSFIPKISERYAVVSYASKRSMCRYLPY